MEASRFITIPIAFLVSGVLAVFLFWFSGTAAPELETSPVRAQPGVDAPGAIRAAAKIGLAIVRIAINDTSSANTMPNLANNPQTTTAAEQTQDESNNRQLLNLSTGEECQVSRQYPEKIMLWCNLITRYAIERGLDPDLIAALILQESGGNPTAYSHSGAVGLMQVMPRDGLAAEFVCPNGPCFKNRPTINQLEDPEFNVDYGTNMLAGLLQRRGSLREALKYYGPADVGYYYADIVLGIYNRYQE